MPDSRKMLACLSAPCLSAQGFGLILILAGGIDIAINCAPSLFCLPFCLHSLYFIVVGIGKIVDLIRFIHFRMNGIPVEGRVYNRLKSYGKDKDGNPQYSYHLWVMYDVPSLNTHTKFEAAASAKYELLKPSNEVDEENFTEREQKENSFNVSEATYEAVNRSGNDSIEVLVLPGKAGYAKLSQTLSSDLKETCVLAAVLLFVGLAFGFPGIVAPYFFFFAWNGDCPGHVKYSYALIPIIIGQFMLVVYLFNEGVEQELSNDRSEGSDGSGATDQHELVTLSTDSTVMTDMMSICTDDADSISGAKATTSVQLDSDNYYTLSELQAHKRKLKQMLEKYDMDFHRQHGRMPVKVEKEPIRKLYENYNFLKNRITSGIPLQKHTQSPGNASQGSIHTLPDFNSNATDSTHQLSSLPSGPRAPNRSSKMQSEESSNSLPPAQGQDLQDLRTEKQYLYQMLRAYERDFFRINKRQVSTYNDYRPVASQYRRYKEIKIHSRCYESSVRPRPFTRNDLIKQKWKNQSKARNRTDEQNKQQQKRTEHNSPASNSS
eukprot:scaffold10203_cov272-Chaetoceros_neogracile.AAC.21